ncbi:hypothetical protein [Mucilaginibacter sp.]|uniref:hypothetical protein n=1 Tax=Mucilaginibacter sp. TaxID=1882438 RepID=UPI0026261521|nr:hypothetical protein [Mucilaginibacter sp.]MDB4919874.1 hypothetical protein [Mucilaginibacter sp.]
MQRIHFLLMAIFICFLCACGNKSGNKPANLQLVMIIGKWNLQKQSDEVYIDGALKSDTTMLASNKTLSYAQFDADGKFSSISFYNSGGIGSTSLGNVIAVDSLSGTYSFAGPGFKLSSAGLGGFGVGTINFITGPVPVIHLVSQSAQIVQLTASLLTLHMEYTTTQTLNADVKNYKYVLDYYYTK